MPWLLVLIGVYGGCICIFDKKFFELATMPKNTLSHGGSFQNCPNVFWTSLSKNTHGWVPQQNVHHKITVTGQQYFVCDGSCCESSCDQQTNSKRFNGTPKKIFRAKYSHHNQKSPHYEENKTINFQMFLCALNEKKGLTAQSIQKSIMWCPISIKNCHILRLAKDLWLISLFKTLSFFISGLISFTIFEILSFLIYFKIIRLFYIHVGRDATEKCSI